MNNLTVRFGTGNELKSESSALLRDLPPGQTVAAIVANKSIQAALRYGDNVEGWVGGAPNGGVVAQEHMTIEVHDKGCKKQQS